MLRALAARCQEGGLSCQTGSALPSGTELAVDSGRILTRGALDNNSLSVARFYFLSEIMTKWQTDEICLCLSSAALGINGAVVFTTEVAPRHMRGSLCGTHTTMASLGECRSEGGEAAGGGRRAAD